MESKQAETVFDRNIPNTDVTSCVMEYNKHNCFDMV